MAQSSLQVAGTLDGIPVTEPVVLTLTRKTVQDIELPANSLDVEVSLGAVSHPEVLIVKGAKGVTWRQVAATGAPIPANPISFQTDLDGVALAQIYLSNADSQAHLITVIAGE